MNKYLKCIISCYLLATLLTGCSSNAEQPYSGDIPKLTIAANHNTAKQLSKITELTIIASDNAAEALINGQAKLAVSEIKWSDDTLSAFSARYGKRPAMTIFTAEAPSDENDRAAILNGEKTLQQPWYLYSNLQIDENEKQQLLALLQYLYSDQGQQQLSNNGLLPMPEAIRNRALVQLGLQAPLYDGGYR